ncbi:MAG: FAD-binding oxidoreductase [Flavobacteriales bacterium]|nr:FAD-binding oxidoreductase [Flavobacteriales bacterium]
MTRSVWEARAFHSQPRLTVVGAGIVGLFTALLYKRRFPGHRVLVVERGAHPSGASIRNAGFACFGSPSELLADIDKEGADAALCRVEERWRGLRELRAELGDEHIGFEPTGGHEAYRIADFLYPRVAEGFDGLNEMLQPILGQKAFHWSDETISAQGLHGVSHVAHTHLEGPIDSGLLMRALLQKAMESGVALRTNAEVLAIEEHAMGVRLPLRGGEVLESEQVLVATNGYTPALLPELDVVPGRGQVLLTEPIEGLRLRGTFHMDEGFYYFRDCAGGVLLGGGRNLDLVGESTMTDGTTPMIQEALERLLREVILPGVDFRIARRWSGIMAFGKDSKQPLVMRTSDRVGVAVRMGGMGVAIGIRVARRAVDLLAG